MSFVDEIPGTVEFNNRGVVDKVWGILAEAVVLVVAQYSCSSTL